MKLKGAQILMEVLLEQGCDTVFGYPGGTVLDIYEELYQYSDRIRHILPSHEQGGVHAADGYARATGKVGVCLATSGPGATNLVTGIATAYLDSIPIVAFTGNVPTGVIGQDNFQEVDIVGVTMGIVKHSYTIQNVEELADIIREAFSIAKSGRPGPVLIDIPKDVQQAVTEFVPADGPAPYLKEHARDQGNELQEALRLMSLCERPCIYCGGGVTASGTGKEILKLAELLDAPVCQSLMGLSAVPASDPRVLGMSGMHGNYASTKVVFECDLLIAVGVRFSDRAVGNKKKYAAKAKIIHIDVDSAEINKNVECDLSLVGDAAKILPLLIEKAVMRRRPEWQKEIAAYVTYEKAHETKYHGSFHPFAIIDEVSRMAPSDSPIVTDVGQHQMFVAQRYPFEKERTCITSGGLGTMGFGMGAANGAAVGTGKKTILFTGDGSFAMNMAEFGTAVTEGLSVVVIVFNNRTLGMVRQLQNFFSHSHYSATTTYRKTDFAAVARAFGGNGYHAENMEEFREALAAALASDQPGLIECRIDPDDFVYPMVPPNQSVEELILQ